MSSTLENLNGGEEKNYQNLMSTANRIRHSAAFPKIEIVESTLRGLLPYKPSINSIKFKDTIQYLEETYRALTGEEFNSKIISI